MSYVFLSRLDAPSYDGNYSKDVINFISAHKSLTTLDRSGGHDITGALVTAAPNLTSLIISPPATIILYTESDNSEPPLPQLRLPSITTTAGLPMSLTKFDTIVSTRFLPLGHPRSQTKGPSHVIAIICILSTGLISTPECHESEIHKRSRRCPNEGGFEFLTWFTSDSPPPQEGFDVRCIGGSITNIHTTNQIQDSLVNTGNPHRLLIH
jgi:hypothetical protein